MQVITKQRQRRLPLRRAPEVLLFSDADEVAQMPQFHRCPLDIETIRKIFWTHRYHDFTIWPSEARRPAHWGFHG
jgi:hypothetical protein